MSDHLQGLLPEDVSDVIYALNDDVRKSCEKMKQLEIEKQEAKSALDGFVAGMDPIYVSREDRDKESKLRGAASKATRELNKQKELIVKQVCEVIDAASGNRKFAPMEH